MAGNKKSSEANSGEEFVPKEQYNVAIDKHDEEIANLKGKVDALENRLQNPEQIAAIFEVATKDSKKFDELVSKLFCQMIDKDENVKQCVQSHIQKVDRDAVKSLLKKWGGLLTAGTLYILGLLTKVLVDWIIASLPK